LWTTAPRDTEVNASDERWVDRVEGPSRGVRQVVASALVGRAVAVELVFFFTIQLDVSIHRKCHCFKAKNPTFCPQFSTFSCVKIVVGSLPRSSLMHSAYHVTDR